MAVPAVLINGTDVSASSQWSGTWEERIDGVGSAQIVIQDRVPASTIEYGILHKAGDPVVTGGGQGWRDILQLKLGSSSLFWGEVTTSKVELPAGFPWRRWKLQASDFNSVFDQRYVGMPDGLTWETIDGGQTHEAIDPYAVGLATDGATIKALFNRYVRVPDIVGPTTFGTTTFVHDWIPTSTMIDPATGLSRLGWRHATLRSAIDEIRSLGAFPIFCWCDPDLEIHWEALPDWSLIVGGTLPLLFPQPQFTRTAPAAIVDTAPNGTTTIGGRDLWFEYDSTFSPQHAYIVGVTDFLRNADGSTTYQGTGWAAHATHRDAQPSMRQLLMDAQTVTDPQKNGVWATYSNLYSRRPRLRGSVRVGRADEAVDGWRVGQLLPITDARLPASLRGHSFPIQRVSGLQKPGQSWREYTLEFGDFPVARFSQKYRTGPQRLQSARLPARHHKIYFPTRALRPSTAYTLTSQMVDRSGKAVRYSGIPVAWSLIVRDSAGVTVATGSIAAITTHTDQHGRTAATLTTGATTGLHYHVSCVTVPQ